jgi:hypothetical protein
MAKKVKAKRSIREMFSREKARAKTPETAASKQGFMSATRSSLAKVMRDSKSLSKVHLPRKTESKQEVRSEYAVDDQTSQAGMFAAINKGKATLKQELMAARRSDTILLRDMVDRLDAQSKDSPERLRQVEIAEVSEALRLREIMLEELVLTVQNKQCVILAAEYSRAAKVSALEAKKSARDAELHADRARLEFSRLQGLFEEAEHDPKLMRFIKNLFTDVSRVGPGEEMRRAMFSNMHTAC